MSDQRRSDNAMIATLTGIVLIALACVVSFISGFFKVAAFPVPALILIGFGLTCFNSGMRE